MVKSTVIIGADFETDGDHEKRHICQWAVSVPSAGWKNHGTDLRGFLEYVEELLTRGQYLGAKKKRAKEHFMFFHNLNYDFSYLLETVVDLEARTHMSVRIIAPRNQIISCTFEPTEESRELGYVNTLKICDSMKKCPTHLQEMGECLGVPKLEPPGDEDFTPGWSEKVDMSKPEAWVYIDRDAEICALMMQRMYDEGLKESTIAGCAWKKAKQICGGFRGQDWKERYPQLPYDLDKKCRSAYPGGINYSDPGVYVVKDGKITHIDMTSMYPTVQYYDPLPKGEPIFMSRKTAEGMLYITRIWVKMKLKKNGIAWYRFKHAIDSGMEGLAPTDPVINCKEWHLVSITNVDLEQLQKDYDVELGEEEYTMAFRSEVGFLRPYIDMWIAKKSEARETGDKALEKIAKAMLNALYGRFGLAPMADITTISAEGDILKLHTEEAKDDDFYRLEELGDYSHDAFIPMAAFTTAHARRRLLEAGRAIIKNGGHLIHADTDSWIFQGGSTEGLEIGKNLGQWKVESEPIKVYEGGFKRYVEIHKEWHPGEQMEKLSEYVTMAAAGVPQRSKNSWPIGMWVELLDKPERILGDEVLGHEKYEPQSDFMKEIARLSGREHWKTTKLLPKKVIGGVDLVDSTYDMTKGGYFLRNR